MTLRRTTIKSSLVKVLEGNPEMWPQIIEGILFAHRVSISVLPIDVKHNLDKDESKE